MKQNMQKLNNMGYSIHKQHFIPNKQLMIYAKYMYL